MRIKDFKSGLKKEGPNTLIKKHIQEEIYLTDKQLDQVIKLNKNKSVGFNSKEMNKK